MPAEPLLSEVRVRSAANPAAGWSVGLSSADGKNHCSFADAEVPVELGTEDILVRLGA